jgi:hypothetical protein
MSYNSQFEKEKQHIIVRQSMIKFTLDYFNQCGICPSMEDVMKVTTILENFCIEGYSKDMSTKFEKIDQYIKDKYKNEN